MKSQIENHIVDLLLPADERRLSDALGAAKPLPASNLEECSELLKKHKKTVSIDFQDQWKYSISRPCDRFDDIDHAAADPVLDRLPAYRKGSDAYRLTSLLDSLERRDG